MDKTGIDVNNLTPGVHKTYYNGETIKYYIPENVNDQTKIFYYVGGSGGAEQWGNYTSSYLENNADSNAIVICVEETKKYNMPLVRENIDNLVSNIYSNANVENIPQIDYSGWSAGAKVATNAAASYYMNENNSRRYIFLPQAS